MGRSAAQTNNTDPPGGLNSEFPSQHAQGGRECLGIIEDIKGIGRTTKRSLTPSCTGSQCCSAVAAAAIEKHTTPTWRRHLLSRTLPRCFPS